MNVATQSTTNFSDLSHEQLLVEISHLRRLVNELTADKNYLEELVRHLKRQRFDRSSEVYASGQGTLFDEAETIASNDGDDEQQVATDDSKPTKGPKKRGRPIRKPLPDHLPQEHRTIDIADDQKVCPLSGAFLKPIGEEVSKQLDIEPMKAKVIVTRRLKYICECDLCKEGVAAPTTKTAEMPPQPLPKSMATPGLLAYIALSKYSDAIPLARLEKIFLRHDITMMRSTMASWIIKLGLLLTPLMNLIREELVAGKVIQADETRIQVRNGTGKKSTAESYMWAFSRDGPGTSKIILYELGPSRSHEVPMRVLEGFEGYLHTDGYGAYETLAAKVKGITLVGDWAHVRRKFDEAIKAVPKEFKGEIKAEKGFQLINDLFRIERKEIPQGATPEVRLRIRQEKSLPIVHALKEWADDTAPMLPPKSLSGTAVRYMLERWSKLILFLDNPDLRLDTNPIEGGVIRPFVIGRKNWMFADTIKGAQASAALYSLIVMAKSSGINPFHYLKSVFTELPKAQSIEDVESLLPWIWKPEVK